MTFTTYRAHVHVAATITIGHRAYEVFRVSGCQVDIRAGGEQCTACALDHWWNVWGIRPLRTPAELAMPESQRPRLPYVYASPIKPHEPTRRLGHPEAPIPDGWQIRDELNRTILGHATTFEEMAKIAANVLHPLTA